jgi:hypothetical protein
MWKRDIKMLWHRRKIVMPFCSQYYRVCLGQWVVTPKGRVADCAKTCRGDS